MGINGYFHIDVILVPPDKRARDLDNFSFKAVLDWCKRVGLITDDSLCRKITAEWGGPDMQEGAHITLIGL